MSRVAEQKSGDSKAGGAGVQSSRTPLARNARGRFVKTKKESRAEVRLAKLKLNMQKMKTEIEKIEGDVSEDSPDWTKTKKTKEQRALWRMAKDFEWLAKMVLKLRCKIKEGSASQQRWASQELPKYEKRKREASEAKKTLVEMHASARKKKKEEEEETKAAKKQLQEAEKANKSVAQVAQVKKKKARTQAMLKHSLVVAQALRQ